MAAKVEPDAGSVPVHAPHTCRNCGAPIAGHYCANCGQETRIALPTFNTFMREAAGRYVAFDGRMWRTLWALIARPGFLTLEYLQGRRRRYIRPARLFLVLYLVLFAMIGLLQSPSDVAQQVVFVNTDDAEPAAKDGAAAKGAATDAKGAPADAKGAKADAKGPPADARGASAGKERAGSAEAAVAAAMARKEAAAAKRKAAGLPAEEDEDTLVLSNNTFIGLDDDLDLTWRIAGVEGKLPEPLRERYVHFKSLPRQEKAERLYAGMLRYGTYAMVALLPMFALLLKVAYLGRGRRYPGRPQRYAEHLVYSAHLHAFAALVLMLLLVLPYGPVKAALAVWIIYYVMRARQVVYRGRWWAGLARSFVIAIVYTVLVAFAILGLLVAAVMLR
jgi:hypothetical protein